MTFISTTTFEDTFARKFVLDTVTNNKAVAIDVVFANGYAVNMVRNHSTIAIDVLKGSMYYNAHLMFVYDEGEFEDFINAISTAESDFAVGFACGKLTPKYYERR